METTQNNQAKYAFFYMLSLVALIFMALSTGMIIFQIINKFIVDILNVYSGQFSSDTLKFAISAIVISAPIFFLTMRYIHKSLFAGLLGANSGIRKWLTYFILLVSSVVMLGWLIATLNSFLNGELSTKFLLKALTAIIISAGVFAFYYYDVKRDDVAGKKDKVISIFFYVALVIVLGSFIASLFVVESPTQTRNRKFDEATLNNFQVIANATEQYLSDKGVMPSDLGALKQEYGYITDKNQTDPITNTQYGYKVTGDASYELCATFLTSNKDLPESDQTFYLNEQWQHDKGEQCIGQEIKLTDIGKPIPRSVPMQ